MKGGVVIDGVDYNLDRFNFIRSLLTPSTNNTQRPNVYMIPIVNNLFNMTTIDEILQSPNYLVINIDDIRHNRFEIRHSYRNPPDERMIIGSSSFVVSEHVFFVQRDGNYKIFNLSIDRFHPEYQAKLNQLGLGDEQRLFPIIQPHQPGQA